MTRKFIKKNDKTYEVKEIEITVADLECDVEYHRKLLNTLELQLKALKSLEEL